MLNRPRCIEWFGWYGAIAILAAYTLISFGFIGPGYLFQFLSITGSIGIAGEAFAHRARPAGWLNAVYAVVGVIALYRLFFH
jgi:hypothetical protein